MWITPVLDLPGYNHVAELTRWPAAEEDPPTVDVSSSPYLGGIVGLDPEAAHHTGTVILKWTTDLGGTRQVGTQGIPLTSLIISNAELSIRNRGPYLYMTYQPYTGDSFLTANLFGMDTGDRQLLHCGDTILVEEMNKALGSYTSTAVYPADYFAGDVDVTLWAPEGVTVRLVEVNLTNDNRDCNWMGPGSRRMIVPVGTWFMVISNATPNTIYYTLAVTPKVEN